MRHLHFHIAILLLLSLALPAKAQPGEDKWLTRAEEALSQGQYLQADEYFRWSLRKDTTLRTLNGLAACATGLNNTRQALQWRKAAARHPEAGPQEFFAMGRTLMSMSRPDEAAPWFAKYHEAAPDAPGAAQYKDVQSWLPELFRDSATYAVSRTRFNSRFDDFGAAWLGNGLIICSNRPSDVAVVHSASADGLPMVDLYQVPWDSAKGFGRATPFAALNTRYHEGPVCVDIARQHIYVTRSTRERLDGASKGQPDPLGIFRYTFIDGKPTGEVPLPGNAYGNAHPCISPDGQYLYFSSNRPGGQGGADIWRISLRNEAWGEPENLGPKVNTPGNEAYPAFQGDGTLFFSSDGHIGLGGIDIFYAKADGPNGWHLPLNPGAPINSAKDDFNLLPRPDGRSGVFTSNRNNGQGDDIWEYTRKQPEFECQPQQENNYCFRFWETGSIETDTLPVYYVWDMGDGTHLKGLEVNHCFSGPGDYIVELNLVDSISGFVFLNEASYEMNIRDIVQPYIEAPDTIAIFQNTPLDGKRSMLTDCNPEQYYWDFGDGSLARGITTSHAWRNAGTYEIRLGITGTKPGSSEPCKACVTRSIQVLETRKLQQVRDSVARAREANLRMPEIKPIDRRPDMDSSGTETRDIRDSVGLEYRVQLLETKEAIKVNDPIFSTLDNPKSVKVTHGDSTYIYTYGLLPTVSEAYPFYREARDKGFEDAIVVAFRGENPVSGNDSTYRIRVPVRFEGDKVVLFSGKIKDSKGEPLAATMTLEDLLNRVEVVRVRTDQEGGFQLRLPDGRIYGYYVEADGQFPYSNYLDLRANSSPTLEINHNVTMNSISEILTKGTAVRINNIFFDYNKSDLRPESYPELRRLSKMLKDNPGFKVEVLGHTDSEGDDSYNLQLSKRRAEAVARYLELDGYGDRILRTIGYGEMLPLAPNETPEGRQMNRRVEFRLMK